jgi:hypothetical protein
MDDEFRQKIERIKNERLRIPQEEEAVRAEAQLELERVIAEIEKLEERREGLESFLNINDSDKRLQHGTIRNLCFEILSRYPEGLTSSQMKDIIEKERPGMRLASVPASLSYQTAQGRLSRDAMGRYTLIDE